MWYDTFTVCRLVHCCGSVDDLGIDLPVAVAGLCHCLPAQRLCNERAALCIAGCQSQWLWCR